ncbi:LOW QUALITY PROTEIN: hypothetical protein Q4I32_001555 [Leishmania shawi]|uniref:Ubiquitin-like protease family profile domain-containing protein n=1 Tax=Leishmania shawi TaxID=5680 RepID=A0AAW3C7M6_9TRYP
MTGNIGGGGARRGPLGSGGVNRQQAPPREAQGHFARVQCETLLPPAVQAAQARRAEKTGLLLKIPMVKIEVNGRRHWVLVLIPHHVVRLVRPVTSYLSSSSLHSFYPPQPLALQGMRSIPPAGRPHYRGTQHKSHHNPDPAAARPRRSLADDRDW